MIIVASAATIATPADPRIDLDPGVILASVNRLLDGFLALLPLLATALIAFVLLLFLAHGLRFVAEKALALFRQRSFARDC